MTQRMNWSVQQNEAIKSMQAIEAWLAKRLDAKLLDLVKMRASQINGCAYCLHMHSEDALKHGETVARLILLDAWRESSLYDERERAALLWTESVTRIAETHAPDEDYQEVRRHFSEAELAALTIAITMINNWNRLSIAARAEHPAEQRKAA
jgi:AhpD family alkylhydroperoxidase